MTEEEALERVLVLFSNRFDRLEKDLDLLQGEHKDQEKVLQDIKIQLVRFEQIEKEHEPMKTELSDLAKFKVKVIAYVSAASIAMPIIIHILNQWLQSPKPPTN